MESLASPSADGHEKEWIVQGPDAWDLFFCSYGDWEDNSIDEEDTSYGYCSDKESFYSTKDDSATDEVDTSYGYCSDKESFYSTEDDSATEEENTSHGYCSEKK